MAAGACAEDWPRETPAGHHGGDAREAALRLAEGRLPSASQRAALRAASTWQAMSADVFDSKELTN